MGALLRLLLTEGRCRRSELTTIFKHYIPAGDKIAAFENRILLILPDQLVRDIAPYTIESAPIDRPLEIADRLAGKVGQLEGRCSIQGLPPDVGRIVLQ